MPMQYKIDLGTIYIKGGTIQSKKNEAIFNNKSNSATIIIGTEDGIINISSPIIIGKKTALSGKGIEFYDGTIKGVSELINSMILKKESNSEISHGADETIDGATYKTTFLSLTH